MRRSAALLALVTIVLPACEVRTHTHAGHPDAARPVATESSWTRHVDIEAFDESIEIDVVLELYRNDRFDLTVAATEDGDIDRETVHGQYRWDGATLVLRGDGETHRFHLRDDELVLDLDWRWDTVRAVAWLPEITLARDG